MTLHESMGAGRFITLRLLAEFVSRIEATCIKSYEYSNPILSDSELRVEE